MNAVKEYISLSGKVRRSPVRTFRPLGNLIAAGFVVVLCTTLVILSATTMYVDSSGIRLTVGIWLALVPLFVRAVAIPRLLVVEDAIIIVNPFHIVEIPLSEPVSTSIAVGPFGWLQLRLSCQGKDWSVAGVTDDWHGPLLGRPSTPERAQAYIQAVTRDPGSQLSQAESGRAIRFYGQDPSVRVVIVIAAIIQIAVMGLILR